MIRYRCPHCGLVQETLPDSEVGHRCRKNRNRWTEFRPDPKGDE